MVEPGTKPNPLFNHNRLKPGTFGTNGRDVTCWSVAVVTERKTREEAEEYFRHFAIEHEDQPGDIGIDGVLLGLNNYDDGLRRFAEVMPLLESRGLRAPYHPAGCSSAEQRTTEKVGAIQ